MGQMLRRIDYVAERYVVTEIWQGFRTFGIRLLNCVNVVNILLGNYLNGAYMIAYYKGGWNTLRLGDIFMLIQGLKVRKKSAKY